MEHMLTVRPPGTFEPADNRVIPDFTQETGAHIYQVSQRAIFHRNGPSLKEIPLS